MPYYHVRIAKKNGKTRWIYAFDLSKKTLVDEIVTPFLKGNQFMCRQSVVRPSEIDYIGINETEQSSSDILKKTRLQRFGRKFLGTNSSPYLVDVAAIVSTGKDVTHEFIRDLSLSKKTEPSEPRKEGVFIVHGTDFIPVKELRAILEEAGLSPIVLHEQPSKGMTLIEKLEKYSNVGFAFIILTPDDIGVGKQEGKNMMASVVGKDSLTAEEYIEWSKNSLNVSNMLWKFYGMFKDRARQNVVLEFGYFMGKLGRERICCLYKGDIELPSDMHGICYVPFKDSINEAKPMILQELREAGYEIRA